ncbi:MAG: hypothetical protein NT062_09210 [Proteobacteria bacterium]|nr:hypothetical protein [Pseudomonadota bacterium]
MPVELVSYALAIIGGAMIVWAVQAAFGVTIDHEKGNAALMKLLTANNHVRARKLCRATPGSYFDAVAAAIEAALEPATEGVRDLITLDEVAKAAFDTKGVAVAGRWRGITQRGLFGVVLVIGGATLEFASGTLSVAQTIAAGSALLVGAWFAYRRGDAQVSLAITRREVMPAILRSIIESAAPPRDASGPFRVPGMSKLQPSLRDGQCLLTATVLRRDLAVDPIASITSIAPTT